MTLLVFFLIATAIFALAAFLGVEIGKFIFKFFDGE